MQELKIKCLVLNPKPYCLYNKRSLQFYLTKQNNHFYNHLSSHNEDEIWWKINMANWKSKQRRLKKRYFFCCKCCLFWSKHLVYLSSSSEAVSQSSHPQPIILSAINQLENQWILLQLSYLRMLKLELQSMEIKLHRN